MFPTELSVRPGLLPACGAAVGEAFCNNRQKEVQDCSQPQISWRVTTNNAEIALTNRMADVHPQALTVQKCTCKLCSLFRASARQATTLSWENCCAAGFVLTRIALRKTLQMRFIDQNESAIRCTLTVWSRLHEEFRQLLNRFGEYVRCFEGERLQDIAKQCGGAIAYAVGHGSLNARSSMVTIASRSLQATGAPGCQTW